VFGGGGLCCGGPWSGVGGGGELEQFHLDLNENKHEFRLPGRRSNHKYAP